MVEESDRAVMTNVAGYRSLLIPLILILGLLPLAGAWYFFGQVPALEPQDAWALIQSSQGQVVIVDVRDDQEFNVGHVEGSVHWRYDQLMAVNDQSQVPPSLAGKRLVLICSGGIHDVLAAAHLSAQFGIDASYVRGGMQAWIANGDQPCGMAIACRLAAEGGVTCSTSPSPTLEQLALVFSGFTVKPIYQLLSFVLIIVLWRSVATDLVALRWGQIFFLTGELFCMFIYLCFSRGSDLFEYLHSYGMVLCFAFTSYALIEGIDSRFMHVSKPSTKCVALPLCQQCIKYTAVPCAFQKIFQFVIPAALIMAFMPLLAHPIATSYNSTIFGTFYNFSHAVIYQIYEIRICPAFAFIFFAVSLFIMLRRDEQKVARAKIFFSAGLGFLGFSFFRLVLFQVFRDRIVWFNFWEEITELLFVTGVALTLWYLRKGLFRPSGKTDRDQKRTAVSTDVGIEPGSP